MFKKQKPKINRKTLKEERFRKVASRRVKEVLNKMRLLRNCTNKANYNYTAEQSKKIINTIEEEWKSVKHDFNKGKIKTKEFNL